LRDLRTRKRRGRRAKQRGLVRGRGCPVIDVLREGGKKGRVEQGELERVSGGPEGGLVGKLQRRKEFTSHDGPVEVVRTLKWGGRKR
jgi:hypothetical protein